MNNKNSENYSECLINNKIFFKLFLDNNINDINIIIDSINNLNFFKSKNNNINLSNLLLFDYLLSNRSSYIIEIITYGFILNMIDLIGEQTYMDHYGLILCPKITIKLIDYYETTDNCNEAEKIILEKKKHNMINIIKDHESIFIDYDYEPDDIIKEKIIQIFIELISRIIIKKKYENLKNILNLENINIAELIPNEITEILRKIYQREDFKKHYGIINKEDLSNENKINFYYYLLKYILKTSKHIISNVPFLFETQKLFLNMLRKNELFFNDQSNINKKRKYVIKTIIDNDYYFRQIPENDIHKLKTVLYYYNKVLCESKKYDIKIIQKIIDNKWGNYKIFLQDYVTAEEMKPKIAMVEYIYKLKNKNEYKENEIIKDFEYYKRLINNKTIEEIKKEDLQSLIEYFREINNKESLIKIFSNNNYKYFINFTTAYLMLDNLIFFFYTNKGEKYEEYEIYFGPSKNKINYQELEKIYYYLKNEDSKNSTIKNFKLFFDFLKKIEEFIINYSSPTTIGNVKIEYDSINKLKYTLFKIKYKSDEKFENAFNNLIEESSKNREVRELMIKKDIISLTTLDNNKNDEARILKLSKNDKTRILKLRNKYEIYEQKGEYYVSNNDLIPKKLNIRNYEFIIESKFYHQKSETESQFRLLIIDNKKLYSLDVDPKNKEHNENLTEVLDLSEYEYIDLFELDIDNFLIFTKDNVYFKKKQYYFDKSKIISIKDKKYLNKIKIDEKELCKYWINSKNKMTKEIKLCFNYYEYKINEMDKYIFYSSKNYLIIKSENDDFILVCLCKDKENKDIILIFFDYKKEPKIIKGFEVVYIEDAGISQFNAFNSNNDIFIFKVDFNNGEVECFDSTLALLKKI